MDDDDGFKALQVIHNQITSMKISLRKHTDLFFRNFLYYVSKDKLDGHIKKYTTELDNEDADITSENVLEEMKSLVLLLHLSACETHETMTLDENFELIKLETSTSSSVQSEASKAVEPETTESNINQEPQEHIPHDQNDKEEKSTSDDNKGISSLEVVITHPEVDDHMNDPYNIIHARRLSDDDHVHAKIYEPCELTDAHRKQQRKIYEKFHQQLLGIIDHASPSWPKITACSIALLNQFYSTILKEAELRWVLQLHLYDSDCYNNKIINLFESRDWSCHLHFLQTIQISLFPPIWNHFDHFNTSLLLKFFHGMTLKLNEGLLSTPEHLTQTKLMDVITPKKSPVPSPIKLRENHSKQNLELIMPNLRMNKHELGDYTYQTFNLHYDAFFKPHERVWQKLRNTFFKMLKYSSRYTTHPKLSRNALRTMVLVVLHEQMAEFDSSISLVPYLKVFWKMMKEFPQDEEILYCGLLVSNFIVSSLGSDHRLHSTTAQKHLSFLLEHVLHQVDLEPETSFILLELFKYLIAILNKELLQWMNSQFKPDNENTRMYEFETVLTRVQSIVSRNRQQRYRDRNPLLEHYGKQLWEFLANNSYLFIPERKLNKVDTDKGKCAPCCLIM